MGYKEIILKLPTDYTEDQLNRKIGTVLNIRDFSYQIDSKSLDARKKDNIHWLIRVGVSSEELKGIPHPVTPSLEIPYQKREENVLVVGNGPAGFFAAYVLQKAGFSTTVIDRGAEAPKRETGIKRFERTGVFDPVGNYAFGEGGAGTFSDGKLTSRSKHISKEKRFIIESYIQAGAPQEIAYMAHPHIGSDRLKRIVQRLRDEYQKIGGKVYFETHLEDLKVENERVVKAVTSMGILDAETLIIAPGNASFDTSRMMSKRGVSLRIKNFAIGSRVEHLQEVINLAQWGKKRLPGVKAAEYRLTYNCKGNLPVFTFCMCPGGTVVPSTAYSHSNIVNGMSRYLRNGKFANSACVAAVHPDRLLQKKSTPLAVLDWLEALERRFFDITGRYEAPYCSIRDFIEKKETSGRVETSYPLGLKPSALWELLPSEVAVSIREALINFSKKLMGFESGIMMGLESKTSSPIQVVREADGKCIGFKNLYVVGEGSGHSGGIISSAADGIRIATRIVEGR
ncbi:MAG: FAD-dependent monooxygenase [Desulfobacterales bacterium]